MDKLIDELQKELQALSGEFDSHRLRVSKAEQDLRDFTTLRDLAMGRRAQLERDISRLVAEKNRPELPSLKTVPMKGN